MLSNFIGGGQIFLHNLRMFLQVLKRSVITASLVGFIVTLAFFYSEFSRVDLTSAITYQKALIIKDFSNRADKFKAMFFVNNNITQKRKHITIRAHSKEGSSVTVPIESILSNRKFIIPYNQALLLLKKLLLVYPIFVFCVFTIIFALWGRFGKKAKEKRHLSGHVVKTPTEVERFLRKHNKASCYNIGNVPLVKNSEVKHILITGSTGSGKTNCLHSLLSQIRQNKQPAVIIDTEGDMIARYYRPNYDIIINPFDKRAHNWDLWQEIKSSRDLKKIATSFFPDSPETFDYDKKWTSWGRMLFIGILEHLKASESPTIENLYNLIHRESLESLTDKLKDTSVGSLLSSKSDNNVAPHNIRINTLLATEWLEFIVDASEEVAADDGTSFCFHDWFNNLEHSKDDRWIFIACDGADSKILLPFISVITDIALNSLISLGIDETRRVWFIFDELAKLKYLPALHDNITLLRKYGGCVVACTQSLNQLFSIYGRHSGSVMLGQFNTNIIFRILAADEAKIITKRIGEIEFLVHQKNTSYGAHEFRDGISYTEQEKSQEVIKPSDLAALSEGECYILLPITEVAICKTTLKLVPKPQNLQPTFIYNHSVEALIQERQQKWLEAAKAQLLQQKSLNKLQPPTNKPYNPKTKTTICTKHRKQKFKELDKKSKPNDERTLEFPIDEH